MNLTKEEALEPEIPICDPHHHLWDHPVSAERYPGRYLFDDILRDTGGGHCIVQTVFMECGSMYRKSGPIEMKPVGETEFVQGIAAQSASGQYGTTRIAAGIVGCADLALGAAVVPVLEAQITASPNRFRGIRRLSIWDASPEAMGTNSRMNFPKGLLLDPKFRQGFSYLQKYGLSFDAWLYHPQLPELADLAWAFPETTIILNHVGGPLNVGPYVGKREEVFRDWKRGMSLLAACPNVCVKIGGFGMSLFGFGWDKRQTPPNSVELAEAIKPYYQACIELFGANRCMFESNFPVDKISFSYTVAWNAFKRVSKGLPATDRSALFHDTAVRIYRLPNEE